MEDRTIDIEVDGIRFISHGHYYEGIHNWLCHKLKENDPQAIAHCASQLAKMLPVNAVVIPIPGHHGFALQTLYLARAINEQSGGIIPVANVLKGNSRMSNYQAKKKGSLLPAEELGQPDAQLTACDARYEKFTYNFAEYGSAVHILLDDDGICHPCI